MPQTIFDHDAIEATIPGGITIGKSYKMENISPSSHYSANLTPCFLNPQKHLKHGNNSWRKRIF
jgi:hypothetical protein